MPGDRTRGREREIAERMRKFRGLMDTFAVSIVIVIFQVYVCVKLSKLYPLNTCSLLYVNIAQ